MGITVDVSNGIPKENGSPVRLTAGADFTWVNNTANTVSITACSGFCVGSSYSVNASSNGTPGTTSAKVNSNPSGWTYTPSPAGTWAPGGPDPGVPRIQNPVQRGHEHNERVA